jgi:hypothetical protein
VDEEQDGELVPQPQVEIYLTPQLLQVLVELVGWEIWTFYETILNSNNSDKSSNKTLKCSSLFYNKLELETHNWLL